MLGVGDHEAKIIVDGIERTYLVHRPVSAPIPAPVVVCLHGRGIDALAMAQMCGMDEVADREGFVTVYPDGSEDPDGGRFWRWKIEDSGEIASPAEIAFLSALLDELPRRILADPSRIYVTGFSNGAILSYLVARELTKRVAAIGAVAGFIHSRGLRLSHPISVIHFHGTRDRLVPYNGGVSSRKGSHYVFPPLADAMQPWLEATGCLTLRSTDTIRDSTDPMLSVRTDVYGPGWNGSEVEIVTVEGGGHTWPGKPPMVSVLGKWTTAISASERMWDFFRRHMREPES